MSTDDTDKKSPQKDDIEIESIGGEPADAAAANGELKAALDEAAKWKNDYLYLRADFDNFRKGVIKERADLLKYGSERLISELLGFLDTVDRALQMSITPENVGQFKTGIEMTANELKSVLERFGVKELSAVEGQSFNPAEHEALNSEESDAVAPGHVLRVYRKAYKLHDRLLRPAQVVVAKAPALKEG